MSDTSHVGYKKCCDDRIVKLEILGENNEGRSGIVDRKYAKFRCEQVLVLDIYHSETKEKFQSATTYYDKYFEYTLLSVAKPHNYDTNIDKVCGEGIHYYLSEEAAIHHNIYMSCVVFETDTQFTSYNDNGGISAEYNMLNGEIHGEYKSYYHNGQMCAKKMYVNGKLHGYFKRYRENDGTLIWLKYYKNGDPIYHSRYDPSGKHIYTDYSYM